MADDYGPGIKRLNYYHGQFLQEIDFNDEQGYHKEMRYRHNARLHTSGVVYGLIVTQTSDTEIEVSPGMALDSRGREIICLEAKTKQINAPGDYTKYVVIEFDQKKTDQPVDPINPDDDFNRWIELAPVTILDAPPSTPGDQVLLAVVHVLGGIIDSIDNGTPPHQRRVSGAAGSLTLRDSTISEDENDAVRLRLADEKHALLSGTLSIDAADKPAFVIHTQHNDAIQFMGEHPNGVPFTFVEGEGRGFRFYEWEKEGVWLARELLRITHDGRVGIGSDSPHATLQVDDHSEDNTWNTAAFRKEALGPNWSHIHYGIKGDWYIRSAANDGEVIIQDTGGNVGIGTENPNATLDIQKFLVVRQDSQNNLDGNKWNEVNFKWGRRGFNMAVESGAKGYNSVFRGVGDGAFLYFDRINGTPGTPEKVVKNDVILDLQASARNAESSHSNKSIMRVSVDEEVSGDSVPMRLDLFDKLINFKKGNVGIGIVEPALKLEIDAGDIAALGIRTTHNDAIQFSGEHSNGVPFTFVEGEGRGFRFYEWEKQGEWPERELLRITHDGKVGIGTGASQPSARLSVVSTGAEEIVGSARSEAFLVSGGLLALNINSELALASIGFDSDGNNSSLGIRALRTKQGAGWESTAIGLGMDVDGTVRAGASLWLHANGNVGIGTNTPNALLTISQNENAVSSGDTIGLGIRIEKMGNMKGIESIIINNDVNSTSSTFGFMCQAYGLAPSKKYGCHVAAFGVGEKYAGYFGAVPTENDNEDTYGVYSSVFTLNKGDGKRYAVFAEAYDSTKDGHYAGYFQGKVYVSGLIENSGGGFLIDHPLDPENKVLRHNFVESPEHLCLYRGRVKLNKDGKAIVKMPEYFAALTKVEDSTVNLTPIGKQPFPASYTWNSKHTGLSIWGIPEGEVAYVVLANRNDPTINNIRQPVEAEKSPRDKGRYYCPEAYGKERNLSIHADVSDPAVGVTGID